jgi:phage shock protein PspC (stress-responsive transcriptional regulator)
MYKKKIIAGLLSTIVAIAFAMPAYLSAQAIPQPSTTDYGLVEFSDVGLGKTTNLKRTIANIINIALGFLGVIAVVIIIYAGFKWMTAGGNEESVSAARKMLVQAIAGLVIIFLAWGIAAFVINQLEDATDASGI